MKTLIYLVVFTFSASFAGANESAHIQVSLRDLGQAVVSKCAVQLTPIWPYPRTLSTNLLTREPRLRTTDTNGTCVFSNTLWGVYRLAIVGSPSAIYSLTLGTNQSGTVSAAALVTNPAALPPNPATNYYTTAQIDALMANSLGTDLSVTITSVAIGTGADADPGGASIGTGTVSTNYGAAVGYAARGYNYGSAVGDIAQGYSYGAAMGVNALGYSYGVAVGYYAKGYSSGAAVGYQAKGLLNGAALGHTANGTNYGAAVGYEALGYNYGSAFGRGAYGYTNGVAVGANSSGYSSGVAVGYGALGYSYGVAVGSDADASGIGNVAIGGSGGGAIASVQSGLIDTIELGRGTASTDGALHFRGMQIVNSNGCLVICGTTNQINFGATNSAPPVDVEHPTHWISVTVAGLTNQFRLGLFQ